MTDHDIFLAGLEAELKKPLPGTTAQFLMAPSPDRYFDLISDNYKKAAVLALIYPIKDKMHLAYIVRSSGDRRDKHAGQISLPGGKLETYDESLLACALREADEEVGIKKQDIKLLGQLSDVFVYVSNFMVYPYVAYSTTRPQFVIDSGEVEQLLEIPLSLLLDQKNIKKKDLTIRDYLLKDVPYYDINGKVLWGATAMMTSELMYIIKNIT